MKPSSCARCEAARRASESHASARTKIVRLLVDAHARRLAASVRNWRRFVNGERQAQSRRQQLARLIASRSLRRTLGAWQQWRAVGAALATRDDGRARLLHVLARLDQRMLAAAWGSWRIKSVEATRERERARLVLARLFALFEVRRRVHI